MFLFMTKRYAILQSLAMCHAHCGRILKAHQVFIIKPQSITLANRCMNHISCCFGTIFVSLLPLLINHFTSHLLVLGL